MEDQDNLFYFVAAPSLMLAVIFFIFALFALIRLKMVLSPNKSNNISVIFYLFIAMETALRTGNYLYITIQSYMKSNSENQTDPMTDKVYLAFQYLPDLFFWFLFTLLLWQLLVLFFATHLNNNNGSIFLNSNPISKGKILKFFLFIWLVYLVIQLICIALFESEIISFTSYSEQNSLFNLLLPFILVILEIYLHIVFSGTPYISLLAAHQKAIINKVLIVWAIGRILHAVWTVYLAFYEPDIVHRLMEEQNLDGSTYAEMILLVSLEIADKIFNEILAFVFVIDLEFVKIFYLFRGQTGNSCNNSNSLTYDHSQPTYDTNSLISIQSSFIKPPVDYSNIEIVLEENQTQLFKKNGFGTLEICRLKSDYLTIYVIRKLKLKGFTNYIAEEFVEDLKKQYEFQSNDGLRLIKVLNYTTQEINNEKFLLIISEYYKNGSLANLLKTQKNLDFEIKAKIAMELCSILQKFHSYDPPLIHGHLNSYNILLDEEFRPIISDYGFFSLKKYYSVKHSYVQKSIYTAPEALKSNSFKREMSMDVYSFGIILYELFIEKITMENMSVKKIIQFFSEEKFRPKIPEYIDQKLANLIRCCWQDEQKNRPSFNLIQDSLRKIVECFN